LLDTRDHRSPCTAEHSDVLGIGCDQVHDVRGKPSEGADREVEAERGRDADPAAPAGTVLASEVCRSGFSN
jgi:hypothetical protein